MLMALRVDFALSGLGECGAGGGAEWASAVERQRPSDQQEIFNLSFSRPECDNVHVTINQASSAVDLILSSVAP